MRSPATLPRILTAGRLTLFASGITLIASGITLIATGCGLDTPRADGSIVRDSAGITIVENDHTLPAWGQDGWRLSAEPVLRIGAAAGDGPDQLFRVITSHRFPDGRIAVVNAGTSEVRFFDGSGRHLQTIGRSGDGPGEFRSPWAVYPHAGDSLMVLDLYREVSVFDGDGTYARQFVPGQVTGERQGAPVGQFADGTLLLMQYQFGESGRTGLGRSMVTMVRIALDGSVASTFGDFEDQTVMYGGGSRYLFGAWAQEAAADSSMWYGPGDRFELREVAFDGSTVRLVRLDLPPVPVTQAHVDEFLASALERVRGTPQEQAMHRMYADVTHPDVFPAHYELMVDEADNLWVQDYQPTLEQDRTWYVFDPTGRYLGSLVIPGGFVVHQIGTDFILGRWTDELDVEYVHMYAIEKPD